MIVGEENKEIKEIKDSSLMKNEFIFNEKIGYELIFYSVIYWLMVSFGFKFNELQSFVDVSKLNISSFVFAFSLMVFFVFSFIVSFKLSMKNHKLEFLFMFLLSFSTGIIIQSLTKNMKAVYDSDSYINQNVLNWALPLTMMIYSFLIGLARTFEFKMNTAFKYIPFFSLMFCFGLFSYILSFAFNESDFNTMRLLAFFSPLIFVNTVYTSILYLCARNANFYANIQFINITSLLNIFTLIPLVFICF